MATLLALGTLAPAASLVLAHTRPNQLPANKRTIQTQEKAELGEFYVVRQAVSNNGPGWSDTILDVRDEVGAVRVREIRIAPLNRNCAHIITVKAVETVLPEATAAKVAGKFKLCSYPEEDFAGVIQVARRADIEPDSLESAANQTIVAKCGTKETLYELPDQDLLKFEALKRADPRIAALWDLKDDVEDRAFGKDFAFAKASAQQNKERQELGAKFVPEIRAGKFDSGFSDSNCAFAECRDHNAKSALQGYRGPIDDKDPAFVELLNAYSLHLAKFDLPAYPPEAQRTLAQGEVRLRIFFDPSSGLVTNAEPLSGDDKLQDASVKAAQSWRFETGAALKSPIEVTLRFGFHCPAK
ncbi:MAG: energy transducer TonB [Candidatus Acidiferrales bacterium]